MQSIKKNIKVYKEILKVIKKYDNIVIYRHGFPDFDAAGTQNGLYVWLKESFPSKNIYIKGKDFVDFTPQLYPSHDDFNIEKIGDFLAICVDVADTKRIDGDGLNLAKYIIKFDHHPNVEPYGNINLVNEELSSCAELLVDFINYFDKKYPLSRLAATYFYSAIVGDTGRFLFSSVDYHTFDTASYLIKRGVVINKDVYLKMYEKNISDLEVQKYLLNNYKVSEHGVAYYLLKEDDLKKLGIRVDQAKTHMSMFSNIKGIGIWVSVSEDTNKKEFRVSIRSKEVAINGVASKYDGGGHAQASGAKLKTLDKLPELISDLDELLK